MKSGFSHFDASHRENFIAAVLLLAMEVDDAVRDFVADLARRELGIDAAIPLLSFGREARLAATDDDNYARVDLVLSFGPETDPSCAFIELKTHNRWEPKDVARQVRDQGERAMARGTSRVRGSMLLAPERLCRRVKEADAQVRAVTWPQLLAGLRAIPSPSPLTRLAISHLEQNMERPAGLDRTLTLEQFEQATTTVACLRQFIVDCIGDIKGDIHGDPMYLTPGDGQPLRGSRWAWHGLSVPFTLDGSKGKLGIYKYEEAPPGEEGAKATLWLEAYLGEGETPAATLAFAPATLAAAELERLRGAFVAAWPSLGKRSGP
jgi:hypothetical protein